MEIKNLLFEADLDVLFLTETDANLQNENEVVFEGYKIVFPIKTKDEEKIRIICLIRSKIYPMVEVKTSIMSDGFASIWLELKINQMSNKLIIGGFYRVIKSFVKMLPF